jgi:hypothetical protein
VQQKEKEAEQRDRLHLPLASWKRKARVHVEKGEQPPTATKFSEEKTQWFDAVVGQRASHLRVSEPNGTRHVCRRPEK